YCKYKIPRSSAPALCDTVLAVPLLDALSQTFIKLCYTILPAICAAAHAKTRAPIARGRRKSKPNFARVKLRRTEPS
ncbi:MAG: hypothetical protein ACLVCW_05250, partial [Campylobacter sp.]